MSAKDIAVAADGLSKVYRIGLKEQTHDTFARAAFDFIRSPLRNYRRYRSLYRFDDITESESSEVARARSDIVWALRDASFEIRYGEVVGIIGRNGAGKSTLLKILTRITPPTSGRAEIRGRVASLLEVGTGFHNELTGRENIYLNGTILGMTRREVDRKFEEIVDFSGIERFIDTPVKRYSSGMAVRLAFAVAAHLEPEILIVDEVLAVGDADFQKKCISKMQDVSRHGRTVLFVSHNMPAIAALCSRAILLGEGKVMMDGPIHEVVSHYLSSDVGVPPMREWKNTANAPGGDIVALRAVRAVDRQGWATASVDVREDIGVEMVFDVRKPGHKLLPHFTFYNEDGTTIFASLDLDPDWTGQAYPVGRFAATAWIPGNFLTSGTVFVTATLITRQPDVPQFNEAQVIAFNVQDNLGVGTARGDWAGDFPGVIRPLLHWTTKRVQETVEFEG
jgi:lipopolysaccharide transport system ATP-binding protein